MMYYISRTGTAATLEVARRAGWRLLVSAKGRWRSEGFRFSLDNGAWTAFSKGHPFDANAYAGVLEWSKGLEDWVVAPDVVGDARATREAWEEWEHRLTGRRVLYALQDGASESDIPTSCIGVFVGGTSAWKDATIERWAAWGRRQHKIVHIGRVNTRSRLARCLMCGVTSADGSGPSRFTQHALIMERWFKEIGRVQCSLFS